MTEYKLKEKTKIMDDVLEEVRPYLNYEVRYDVNENNSKLVKIYIKRKNEAEFEIVFTHLFFFVDFFKTVILLSKYGEFNKPIYKDKASKDLFSQLTPDKNYNGLNDAVVVDYAFNFIGDFCSYKYNDERFVITNEYDFRKGKLQVCTRDKFGRILSMKNRNEGELVDYSETENETFCLKAIVLDTFDYVYLRPQDSFSRYRLLKDSLYIFNIIGDRKLIQHSTHKSDIIYPPGGKFKK